jgi:hypothetical protein
MNRKLLTIKKCEEIYEISKISLINYEKKIDNFCRKWKKQNSYPTTCQPTEGTSEGLTYR